MDANIRDKLLKLAPLVINIWGSLPLISRQLFGKLTRGQIVKCHVLNINFIHLEIHRENSMASIIFAFYMHIFVFIFN